MNIQKRHIVLGCTAFVLLMALLIFNSLRQSGTLELVAPSKTPDGADVVVDVYAGKSHQNLTIKAGKTKKLRVHIGAVRVDGSSETMRSIDVVTVHPFKTTTLQTPQAEQRGAKQIGTNAKDCPLVVGNQVYSYSCNSTGGVVRQSSAFNLGEPYMFGAQTFNQLKPVKNGLIGYREVAGVNELDYLDLPTETIHPIGLPDAIRALAVRDQPNIIPENKPGASRFAMVFSDNNTIYVFDDITDNSPVAIKPPKDIHLNDSSRLLSVNFINDTVTLFAGLSDNQDEGVVNQQDPKRTGQDLPCYLFEYNASDGKLAKTTNLPKISGVNHFDKLLNDFYAAEGSGKFDFYHLENGSMQLAYTINDVSTWVLSDNTLLVQANGTLYQFVPKQDGTFSLQGRFSAGSVVVSGLYNSTAGILFTAFLGRTSDAPYNIYQLLDSTQTDNSAITRQPAFVGFNPLLVYVTNDQFYNLEYALTQFADTKKLHASSIKITNIDPVPHDRFSANMFDTVNFLVTINDTNNYKATLDYAHLSSIHLNLYDPQTNAQVFDSSTINLGL